MHVMGELCSCFSTLMAGLGAMWDSTGSHWSEVGRKVPEMMRMVSLSCLSTRLASEEKVKKSKVRLHYSAL